MKKFKLFKLLALLVVLITSINSAWATDWTSDGTRRLYITNCKPYDKSGDQNITWGSEFTNSSARIYAYFWKGDNKAQVEVSLSSNVYSGTDRTEGCVYVINVPSGTWSYVKLIRASSSGWSYSSWDTNKWNETGNIELDASKNHITQIKINDSYTVWDYITQTVTPTNHIYIYYDNSNTQWDNSIQFLIGHQTYGRSYPLNKLSGTKLACRDLNSVNSGTWSDATFYAVVQHASTLTEGSNSSYANYVSYSTHRTAAYSTNYKDGYNLNDNNAYLCTTTSGIDGTDWTITHQDGGYSALNKTQTIKVYLKETEDGSYTNQTTAAGWKGTLTPDCYWLNSATNAAHNTTALTPGSSVTVSAALTSAFSLSQSSTATGYTFDGWGTSPSASPSGANAAYTISAITGANTIYAFFSANTYGVTINRNGGSADGSATATYNQGTLDITTAPEPSEGYHVVGYYLEPECTNQIADKDGNLIAGVGVLTDEDGKWISTSGTTIYPKWSNEYAITFDQNEPTIIGTSGTTATYNSAMPTVTVPRKDGYIFGGYYYDAACTAYQYYYDDGRSAHTWDKVEDATLYAKWTGISYQVSFDGNGSTDGTMSEQDFIYGDDPQELTTNVFTRTGYYFLGWNTHPDGSGTDYKDGKSVQNLTTKMGAVITLYAQWAEKHTLYFILAGVGWTPPYAKATITFDEQTYYPLDDNVGNWVSMTNVAEGIYLTNVSNGGSHDFSLYKIDGVPEGTQINFSDNGSDATGDKSWSADRPYYMYGNATWYALDAGETKKISAATNMSVHVNGSDYGIDQYADEQYAIVELSANKWYGFKYHNWLADKWSGCSATGDASNIPVSNGVSNEWTLNGEGAGYDVHFQTTVAGEYKFVLTGYDNTAPKTKIYYPVGVSLGLDKTLAAAEASITVTLTATPTTTAYLMTSPTYYYQISMDGGSTWNTIAETSSTTYDYTFAARTCKFRVVLKNDAYLKSTSGTQDFKTYTTKSFYVYNPYNTSGNWSYLHLYTWDSNDGNRTYNGNFPGSSATDCGYIQGVNNANPQNCQNGNTLEYKGDDWFYITIDERANCFQLVGEGGCGGSGAAAYNCHQTVTCYVSDYIQDAKYMIFTENSANYVREYQAKGTSDFRLKYSYVVDEVTKYRYSDIYNTTLDGEAITGGKSITTSMWLNANDATANLVIQQGNGEDSWTDIVSSAYSNSTKNGFGGLISSSATHGYVFTMKLNINTGTPASSTISDAAEYTGPFYVRTDGLEGGWNVYKSKTNQMVKSESSLSGTPSYNYYICKWIGSEGTNVKYTIANDYNSALVENLEGDATIDGEQKLPQAANVRFAWNSQTNTLTRSYLSGSTDLASRFLMLEETSSGKMYNSSGAAATELLFADNGNWVYQIVMYANPGAQAKVTAKYNNNVQEFISSMQLIGGTGSTKFKYRTVYDFKTNKLVTAFFPEDVIDKQYEINADMMILREGQGVANQITFSGTGELSNVKKVYGVMQFNKSTITANTPASQRGLYWISFPFNVRLGDVFGFGDYGRYWIIEEYNGAKRATDGYWADSEGFWEYVVDTTGVILYAGKGYVLALDLDLMTASSSVWDNSVTDVYLYFPSTGNIGNVMATNVEVTVPSHECTINRHTPEEKAAGTDTNINKNRTQADSHWNIIGVPSYANYGTTNTLLDGNDDPITWNDAAETNDLPFLYEWDPADNTYEVQSGTKYDFQSMYAYMVQYTGTIKWQLASATPPSVAARQAEVPDVEYMLSLIKDSVEEDHTFVRMSDKEGVTAGFEFGQDLCKEYNGNKGNIYTFVGYLPVAGNSQPHPLTTTIVPVGVKIAANGEYTFSMPEGTNGGDVWLIDNANSSRTNLGLMDYTVTLTTGTYEGRFSLEFPVQNVVTDIENAANANATANADDAVRKVFVGGQLYIIRDGVIYNASGARVQ